MSIFKDISQIVDTLVHIAIAVASFAIGAVFSMGIPAGVIALMRKLQKRASTAKSDVVQNEEACDKTESHVSTGDVKDRDGWNTSDSFAVVAGFMIYVVGFSANAQDNGAIVAAFNGWIWVAGTVIGLGVAAFTCLVVATVINMVLSALGYPLAPESPASNAVPGSV